MNRIDTAALTKDQLIEAISIQEELQRRDLRDSAKKSFMAYVNHVYDGFIVGRHHKIIAKKLERIVSGDLNRLIVNMPPRHSKSEFASYLMPSWFLGQNPKLKIIQATMNTELASRFGRKVRDLIADPVYGEIFPSTDLKQDSQAAGRWETSAGGEYFAAGVGAAMTGRGADLLIIDDPHSEQDALSSTAYDNTWEWYTSGPRQRLQPGGAIIIVMTRWHKRDLTGQILKSSVQREGADEWEVIELPAILPSGSPLWPGFWSLDELTKLRSELPVSKWSAQYQQDPTSEEGAIIKREWWRHWTEDSPPPCEFIIQSWDTAFLKKERSDYSACTTWGIFYMPDDEGRDQPNLILLDAMKARMEFPELKMKAFEEWKRWSPDAFIVEAKAAGLPLIFELRAMGIPVQEYTPSRGNDKIARVNAVSDLFASGMVWCPDRRFSEEVMEEFAAFPSGEHDDLVDSSTQALIRFRQGGFVSLNTDDDEDDFIPVRADYY